MATQADQYILKLYLLNLSLALKKSLNLKKQATDWKNIVKDFQKMWQSSNIFVIKRDHTNR